MITPEQFSFSAEKNLFKEIGKKALVNAEILSFDRIAHRVSIEVGGYKKTNLTKVGKSMIINSIIAERKQEFKFLGGNLQDANVAISAISELKKHNVKSEMLDNAIKSSEDIYLKTKLQDVTTIFNSYEEFIKNKFIDEEDRLSILANQIKESVMFDNSYVYSLHAEL